MTVDEEISQTIAQVTNGYFQCFGALGAVAGATKGAFLVLLVPLMYIYLRIQKYFRKTNTAVARLESVSRSPIYADFSQALTGLNSIRAYSVENRFISVLERRVDANSIAAITQQLASQWLSIRLDLIGATISFFVAVLAASVPDFVPAGYIGIGLSFSFQLTQYLKFAVRMSATGEAQMNAIERIKYYVENIDPEEPLSIEELRQQTTEGTLCCGMKYPDRVIDEERAMEAASKDGVGVSRKKFSKFRQVVTPPEEWPRTGCIEGKNVKMSYRDGPLVLKGVSFFVDGSEKVGIAGRTG